MPPHLFLVVPVYNEEANVPRLLASIEAQAAGLRRAGGADLEVVFVDDGSDDGTYAAIQAWSGSFPACAVRHHINQGPGRAFQSAFSHLSERLTESDLVISMEGDNTSALPTAEGMLVRLQEGYDAVLASPYAYGGGFSNTSLLRMFLSHGANSLLKGAVGIHGIHTMSSFFRLYRGSLLLRLQQSFGPGIVECSGFECMVELLVKMMLLGARISEVEMLLDSSLRTGPSKMKIGRTIRGYLSILRLQRRWSRRTGTRLWRYSD